MSKVKILKSDKYKKARGVVLNQEKIPVTRWGFFRLVLLLLLTPQSFDNPDKDHRSEQGDEKTV